jgi:superfamily II DNA or RNA helicase
VDQRGQALAPDFRRYEGSLRETIREYEAERRRSDALLLWRGTGAPEGVEVEPGSRLVELALEARILVDEGLQRLEAVQDLDRLVLRIEEESPGRYMVRPLPASIAEKDLPGGGEVTACVALGPRHVLCGRRVHEVADLGPEWRSLGEAMAVVKGTDLPLHLSTQVSRFPGVEPSREGYAISRARARIVRPALLFREIDAYGYLHVRPFGLVEGFPPGFLEDHELSRIVEIDEAEGSLAVADLVYPRFADEEFRRILAASGREAKAAVFEEAGRFIIDPDFVGTFLVASMRELMGTFALFEAEKLARYKVVAARPKLRFRFATGIDFLGGEAEMEIGGERIAYADFLREYEREGCVTLSDGARAFPDARDIERYQRLLRRVSPAGHGKAGKVELHRVSDIDLPALEREAELENADERWERARAFYRGLNDLAKATGSGPGIEGGELRPYQVYGARWIDWLARNGRHGCLADEMGLGKTVQTIAALRGWRGEVGKGEGPILVVMPRSLLFNWKAELSRFAPEFRVLVHHGTERGETLPEEGLDSGLVILTSYATLRNDLALFDGTEFSWLILDESQSIKNAGTQTHAAVTALRSRRRLALSGTPVENHLGELYSLFDFLEPGFFGGVADFARAWKTPVENGDEEALRELKARIYPFILRRRKAEVLPELPARTEQTSLVELEPAHLALYHRRRLELKAKVDRTIAEGGFAKSGLVILAAMTELRRLASVPEADGAWQGVSAKRLFLRESLPDLVESGHKALIFTNWLAGVELVSEDLAALGIGNLVMTGATSDRASLVERFQSDPAIGAFTMTLKTGGLGLNLTAADYVFLLDPWWNRAAEAQAIDRTHRIGQVNPVFCYRLIAKDTIEERLLELQERKAGLVASLLSADSDVVKALDADDIAFLMG